MLGLGWEVDDAGRCHGEVTAPDGRPVALTVTFTDGFPFSPPSVVPYDGSGSYSWHQNRDGSLCLYDPADAGLPWLEARQLVVRIEEWFARDHDRWSGDAPDLDLERYFDPAEGVVIYDDLAPLIGRQLRLRPRGRRYDIELGGRPRTSAVGVLLAQADDLGELDRPVRDWGGIAAVLGGRAADMASRARNGQLDVLLLRYTRDGHEAAVALRVTATKNPAKPPRVGAMMLARADAATLRLRSGNQAKRLEECGAAIVGLGAVGSFLADLLVRSGIGRLLLCDGDALRPGNSIRHLAGERYWGWNKAKAVGDLFNDRDVEIEVDDSRLVSPDIAAQLLQDHDIVIDATANAWTHELLAEAAQALSRPSLAVYLQRDGAVARIDRRPYGPGEEPAPSVQPRPGVADEPLREGGCGDPISATPPWAVVAAAARGASLAVRMLSGENVPASTIDVLLPEEDLIGLSTGLPG
jgi:molybdopterin/thiamine biosynthesis adenylyltransferase